MRPQNIAVVGATGAVGVEILRVLERRRFPVAGLKLLASKRSVGKTYVGYLNELRINRACRALIETDLNITQIAYDAGFNNLSNFNRRFLDVKGMTPRAYRTLAQTSSAAARKALRNAEWNKVQTKIPWQE